MDCLSLVIPAAIGVLAGSFFLGHNKIDRRRRD
ncbi:hypothetical protein M2175_004598 [Bradyrhizobium elkanii]|nr:hypothetical protein [Bradyrhizobium elkanii]MCS3970124.1 hypothetical protein [Bradyrhizobium japonicum]